MKPAFSREQYFARGQERIQEAEVESRRRIEYKYSTTLQTEWNNFRDELTNLLNKVLRNQENIARYNLLKEFDSQRESALISSHQTQQSQHELSQLTKVRDDVMSTEEEERRALLTRERQRLAFEALKTIPTEEQRWRLQITLSEHDQWKRLWHGTIAPKLLFYLTSPLGTHSEPNYRKLWEIQERRGRANLALRFVLLMLQWKEEWRRLTVRLAQKCFHDYLQAFHRTAKEEAVQREEYSLLFEPVLDDIREQVKYFNKRKKRRDNKLVILRQLREVEVQNMRSRELERSDYVRFWKSDELSKIRDAQALLLQEVAMAEIQLPSSPGEKEFLGNGGGGGDDVSTLNRLSKVFESDLSYLTENADSVSFQEILTYRRKLVEFDDFVTAVEDAVIGAAQRSRRSFPTQFDDEETADKSLAAKTALSPARGELAAAVSASPRTQRRLDGALPSPFPSRGDEPGAGTVPNEAKLNPGSAPGFQDGLSPALLSLQQKLQRTKETTVGTRRTVQIDETETARDLLSMLVDQDQQRRGIANPNAVETPEQQRQRLASVFGQGSHSSPTANGGDDQNADQTAAKRSATKSLLEAQGIGGSPLPHRKPPAAYIDPFDELLQQRQPSNPSVDGTAVASMSPLAKEGSHARLRQGTGGLQDPHHGASPQYLPPQETAFSPFSPQFTPSRYLDSQQPGNFAVGGGGDTSAYGLGFSPSPIRGPSTSVREYSAQPARGGDPSSATGRPPLAPSYGYGASFPYTAASSSPTTAPFGEATSPPPRAFDIHHWADKTTQRVLDTQNVEKWTKSPSSSPPPTQHSPAQGLHETPPRHPMEAAGLFHSTTTTLNEKSTTFDALSPLTATTTNLSAIGDNCNRLRQLEQTALSQLRVLDRTVQNEEDMKMQMELERLYNFVSTVIV